MHQGNLPSRAAKTQKTELEPKAKGLPETDLRNLRRIYGLQRASLVRVFLAKANRRGADSGHLHRVLSCHPKCCALCTVALRVGLVLFHLKGTPRRKMFCLAVTGHPHFALRDDRLYAKRVCMSRHDGIRGPSAFKHLVKASVERLFFEVIKV